MGDSTSLEPVSVMQGKEMAHVPFSATQDLCTKQIH